MNTHDRAIAYSLWNITYETTRDPAERREAASVMINLRKILGLGHNAILKLARGDA